MRQYFDRQRGNIIGLSHKSNCDDCPLILQYIHTVLGRRGKAVLIINPFGGQPCSKSDNTEGPNFFFFDSQCPSLLFLKDTRIYLAFVPSPGFEFR